MRHAKDLQAKARHHNVVDIRSDSTDELYGKVQSAHSGECHHVYWGGLPHVPLCTCDWQKYNPHKLCSHGLAFMRDCAIHQGWYLSLWVEEQKARRQHCRLHQLEDGLYITQKKRSK